MAAIQDHSYIKICSKIASSLSISIASARKKVELASVNAGAKSIEEKKALATKLLDQAYKQNEEGKDLAARNFDQLLVALEAEENFMVED